MEHQQGSKHTYHRTRAATNQQREEEARNEKRREKWKRANNKRADKKKKHRSNKSARNCTPIRQRRTSEAVVTQRENIAVAVLGTDVVG